MKFQHTAQQTRKTKTKNPRYPPTGHITNKETNESTPTAKLSTTDGASVATPAPVVAPPLVPFPPLPAVVVTVALAPAAPEPEMEVGVLPTVALEVTTELLLAANARMYESSK